MHLSPLDGLVALPVLLYYQRWKKIVTKVNGIQEEEEFLLYNTTGLCHKVHKGRKSMLEEIEPELKAYILNL